jgi:hypothetical protein
MYGNNEERYQSIKCPGNRVLYMEIGYITLQVSDGCVKDSLSLFDGSSTTAGELFKLCATPDVGMRNFLTSTNEALLLFKSDEEGVDVGYKVLYTCSEIYTGSSSTIFDSGGLSANYKNSENSAQVIKCKVGEVAFGQFSLIDIQGGGGACTNGQTPSDSLTVLSVTFPAVTASTFAFSVTQLLKECRKVPSASLWSGKSDSNILILRLFSDLSGNRPGYEFTYTCLSVDQTITSTAASPTTSPVQLILKSYDSNSGTLYDLRGADGDYGINEHTGTIVTCPVYLSNTDSTNRNLFPFTTIDHDIEESPNCTKDSIRVYDGTSDVYPLLYKGCGKKNSVTVAPTQRGIYIRFDSDGNNTGGSSHKGYSLSWNCVYVVNQLLNDQIQDSGVIFDSGNSVTLLSLPAFSFH